jgi:hypothetical protein
MCLACQMEDEELWLAYLDQMAQKAAQQAASPEKGASGTAEVAPARQAPSASPFACEELPPE